ncbi:RNA polymerase II-associated protein 1-like isoform X2 [Gigantopelta aegis]|uniref:RNA polymerase II-associated protein 1-like isoform X2 n=1 Tax=Gigantopelta aegis TaxID=1735272 RepID=UPI001B88ABE2|nr:RNA polymerase II-associated protein 1-like isoform X2 [Gigantopelta aegis]
MIRRPKKGETEEDLLKFQQEFLSSGKDSAANVVKRTDKRKPDSSGDARDQVQMEAFPSSVPTLEPAPSKKSKFQAAQEKASTDIEDDPYKRLDKDDKHMAAILSHIMERDTRNAAVLLPRQSTQPFPSVLHRTVDKPTSGKQGKKMSLFAQQMAQSGPVQFGVALQQEVQKHGEMLDKKSYFEQDSGRTSKIIHGTGLSASLADEEAQKIHSENLKQMASMTEQEILEEQKKLLEMLDPKLVEYLRNLKKDSKSSAEAMETSDDSADTSSSKKGAKKMQKETPDLPLVPEKDWLHMDKIEYDKLEWMKELPPPVTGNSKTGKPARFDFQGNLLQADADIPVTKGLHHHGDEPERAGYSLEELFGLARSTNIQQRTLALHTLARVVTKAKSGGFIGLIQTPVLPSIIDAGVIFLLRWSLDDSVDAVVFAAVSAMHALLCNMADEACQDRVTSWFQGQTVASLRPSSAESSEDGIEEKPDENDADVAKKDLILALVTRMRFLQRLFYILKTRRPQAVTVVQLLDIFTRIASHSAAMAYEIVHFPGLIDLIVQEFLPTAWHSLDTTKPVSEVYGVPLPAALRMVRKICQAGKNMAAIMIANHNLRAILLRYIAVTPRDMQLPFKEASSLQTESFRVWRICLSYGLSAEIYVDLYSTLVKYLQTTQQRLTGDLALPDDDLNKDADMLSCLESVILVAATPQNVPGFTRSQDGMDMESESSDCVTSPAVIWSHVTDLLQPVTSCLKFVFNRIKDTYQFKKFDLQFATSCVNMVATFYAKLENQPGYNPVDCLQQIETFLYDVFLPCWKSLGFQVVRESLSKHSNLISGLDHSTEETMTSLPELQTSFPERDLTLPVLSPHSPFPFLTACLRLAYIICKLHKGLIDEVHQEVSMAEDLVSYMKKISLDKPSPLRNNYFTRFENIFQFYVIKLQALKVSHHASLFHQCGLQLLTRLHHGDEHLAHDILSTVIFNPHFISEGKDEELACRSMAEMKLGETTHLRSATQEEITVTRSQLMQDAYSCLPSIRTTYLTAFSMWEKSVRQSRSRHRQVPQDIDMFLTSQIGEFLLPCDWMYLPLVDLFNKFSTVGSSGSLPPNLVTMASDVLRWVFLLECWRPNILASVSVTLKISRVMCAFMAGNDLFLERSVHCYLAALLREYTKPVLLDKMKFDEPIPGLSSFYELYLSLLEQYEAVSFGDSLFGSYILLPMQQKHESDLRTVIWGEKPGILRSLFLPVKELLIPIERFLSPDESDVDLLKMYFGHLMSQTVRAQWSPLMYLIAVHHVNRFLFYTHDSTNTDLRNKMWNRILVCKLEVWE